mmetsp:Transcript_53673/g.165096  ORF Transcript_53673/g.165096 Transcript_53673/m.165096 type:complete len:212 (-) Transcript_53673:786-1421(-)
MRVETAAAVCVATKDINAVVHPLGTPPDAARCGDRHLGDGWRPPVIGEERVGAASEICIPRFEAIRVRDGAALIHGIVPDDERLGTECLPATMRQEPDEALECGHGRRGDCHFHIQQPSVESVMECHARERFRRLLRNSIGAHEHVADFLGTPFDDERADNLRTVSFGRGNPLPWRRGDHAVGEEAKHIDKRPVLNAVGILCFRLRERTSV